MSYGSTPPPSDDRPDPTQNPDEPTSEGYGSPPPPPPQYGSQPTEPSPQPGGSYPPPPPPPPAAGGGYQQGPPSSGGYQPPPPAEGGSYPPPPPPAYGQGQQGYGAPAYSGPYEQASQVGTLAQWPQRALGGLIDFIALSIPGWILTSIGGARVDPVTGQVTGPNFFYWLGFLYFLGVAIYNRWYLGGTTGQSLGRRVAGVKVVKESTGEVLGMGMAFVRDLAHVLDGFFYIGYLWPLWDEKRQTFADKVLSTVVVEVPKG